MKLAIFALVVVTILVNSAQAQDKAYSRAAAEKSFLALANARDGDIVLLIEEDGLVCFADSLPFKYEDRFLTIVLTKPTNWIKDEEAKGNENGSTFYDGKTEFAAYSYGSFEFRIWLNQHSELSITSSLRGRWHSYGHYEYLKDGKRIWKAVNDDLPTFQFSEDKDIAGATGINVVQDATILNASKKSNNKNSGTTGYAINVRVSTGTYTETWTPDKGDGMASAGNCYKAKDFIGSRIPKLASHLL